MAANGRRIIRATAVLLAGAAWQGSASSAAAGLPCAGGFAIVHKDRVFDGARIGIVVFRAPAMAFLSDTFGAWTPRDGAPGEALVLRHRLVADASVTICTIPRSEAPVSEPSWTSHLRALVDESGGSIQILETLDSEKDSGAVSVLGMPTRSVILRRPSIDGGSFLLEQRLLAADASHAVLFRLSVPESAQSQVTADLQLFIARLEKM
ncbi:MAG: hypothetical protein ACREIA_10670 [Opitutaceae bacterium]